MDSNVHINLSVLCDLYLFVNIARATEGSVANLELQIFSRFHLAALLPSLLYM